MVLNVSSENTISEVRRNTYVYIMRNFRKSVLLILALWVVQCTLVAQQKTTGSIGLKVDLSALVVDGNKLKYEMEKFRPRFIVIAIDTTHRFLRADAIVKMKDTIELSHIEEGVYDIKFFEQDNNAFGFEHIIYTVKSVAVYAGKQTDMVIRAGTLNITDTVSTVYYNAYERPFCSRCHKADKTVPIVYGYPSKKGLRDAKHKRIILGGCMPAEAKWFCLRDRCDILKYYW